MSRSSERAPLRRSQSRRFLRPLTLALACSMALGISIVAQLVAPQRSELIAQAAGPANPCSGPIAITSNDQFVWSVNPDAKTVTAVRVTGDANVPVRVVGTDT